MTENQVPAASAINTVRSFLRRYYLDEESEAVAATRALEAPVEDKQERWRLAKAFDEVLAADLPDGTLQKLAFTAANKDVLTDADARDFLVRVYDDNALDVAFDYDEP